MITLCKNCEYLHPDTNKRHEKYWLCMKCPRIETDNFLTDEKRITEPYMYCIGINGGKCPMYKPKRTTQKELEV